jgi:hypothetical protein
MAYPTSLDSLGTVQGTDSMQTHSSLHREERTLLNAVVTKVGIDASADTDSLDYKVSNASSSNPGHKHTLAQGATDVTASAAELNILDGATLSTAELNVLDGVTATTAELNYVDGVTSAIQTQLNAKEGVVSTVSVASSATPTPTGDATQNSLYITALAEAAELQAPSGTPANGNKLIVRIKDDGTARALTYNAIYRGVVDTLPATTTISKTLYMGFIYNSADSKWDLIASAEES